MRVDDISAAFTRILLAAALMVAPVLVPLAPAGFVGIAVYDTLAGVDEWVRVMMAVTSASGLELVGFISAHVALRLYALRKSIGIGRFVVAAAMVMLYIVAGVMVIYQVDGIGQTARAVGQGAVVLSVSVYVLTGLNIDINDAKRERERIRKARARTRAESKKKPPVNLDASPDMSDVSDTTPGQSRLVSWTKTEFDRRLAAGEIPPGMSSTEIAIIAGVSDRTVRRWMAPHRKNGNGVVQKV